MRSNVSSNVTLPQWMPEIVRLYIDHIEKGVPLRALARENGGHASTILRKVRRCEAMREDPLVDEALTSLGEISLGSSREDICVMTAPFRTADMATVSNSTPITAMPDDATFEREAIRVLRRLVEPGAVLAIAPDMEKAAVLRTMADGKPARTAVVDRAVAQAFALKDWIAGQKVGRITRYEITAAGRASLKRMVDAADRLRQRTHNGMAEAAMPFTGPQRHWVERELQEEDGPRKIRFNLAESPIAILGRRRDKDGKLFLDAEMVQAAEQLREDFELAQMGPRIAQNWERFLTGGDRGGYRGDSGLAEGPRAARDRVAEALRDLGPGLADVALRVCCFLEGIEAAEKRMGWSARSGKIVLRIALQRLAQHYREAYGKSRPKIG